MAEQAAWQLRKPWRREVSPREVKIDEVIFGHLTELNGRFKLRATELTFAPDGYVGVHHHIGPGIRYVITGELTFAEGGSRDGL